jgi:cardiolipin synthase
MRRCSQETHEAALAARAASLRPVRAWADRAFSRTAGAPLVGGNHVRILKDAAENYPAWLDAIAGARHHVYFENYLVHDDEVGLRLADALVAAARSGVKVRVIYDWLGCAGKASRSYWRRLRAAGIEVRAYNPPHLESPLGWLNRDHRKMLSVDGRIGFITGLCVGRMWIGDPARGIEPWRDTGVEIRGPAVVDVEHAFAEMWATLGEPIPVLETPAAGPLPAGDVNVRVVASIPSTAGMLRLDQLFAAVARRRVWLTDAYYAGVSSHVQAMCAAAREGVDVRLLVPNATDIPVLKPVSRAGYRPLLEAGVRVFEWNGTMIHAKTAVVDGRWARVGSTNLNLASWIGNCELDAVIEDERIAGQLEDLFLRDLENATEVVLEARPLRRHLREAGPVRHPRLGSGGGRSGAAAAGAVRVGHTLGAALTDRRTLEPAEGRVMVGAGLAILLVAALAALAPEFVAYPLAAVLGWLGLSVLVRAYRLHRRRQRRLEAGRAEASGAGPASPPGPRA